MIRALVIAALFAACDNGSETGPIAPDGPGLPAEDAAIDAMVGSFDEELPDFRTAICSVAATCDGQNMATCETDVTTDMADAKDQLDDSGEMACARCMHQKTIEANKILAANCQQSAADLGAIIAHCDLTPGNGMDSDDEACAGFP